MSSRRIFSNAMALAAVRVLDMGTNFVLAVFISRELGASNLGIYATAMAYYTLVAVLGHSGPANLLIREIAKEPTRTATYLVNLCALTIGIGLLAMVTSWIVVPFLGYSAELEQVLLITSLVFVPAMLRGVLDATLVARQRVALATMTTLVAAVIVISVSLTLLHSGYGVLSLLVVFVCVQYGVVVVEGGLVHRFVARLRLSLDLPVAKKLIRDSRLFVASSFIAAAFARPEVIILSLVNTEAQVGFYSAALRLVEPWIFIPQTYAANVLPYLSRAVHLDEKFDVQRIQDFSVKVLVAIGLPISVGLAAAAEPLILTFYGDAFEESILVLRVLAIVVALMCINELYWRVLVAQGHERAMVGVQVRTIVTRLTGGVILSATLGALGAAINNPVNYGIVTALNGHRVTRAGTTLRIITLAWRPTTASAVMGVVVFALSSRLSIWFLIPIAVLLYGVILVALRGFSSADLSQFRLLRSGDEINAKPGRRIPEPSVGPVRVAGTGDEST